MADQAPEENNEDFDQFKELTKKLLAVSKEDLDKQRKSSQSPTRTAQ